MKKWIGLVLVLLCLFFLTVCIADKHSCRPVEYEDKLDLLPSALDEPFVTDKERDELLNKAVKNYLDDLGENSVSFTYEITGTQLGVYEDKETILYWVKIVYGEGFATVLGFIIQ